MRRYIEFVMRCELKKNIPQQVIETLKFLTNPGDYDDTFENHPEHPVFETDDWEYMLGDSKLEYDEIKKKQFLSINSSIKDYEEQILAFLHWIVPYSNSRGIVGYIQQDYYHFPSRILFEKGHAYVVEPVENIPGLEEYARPPQNKRLQGLIEGFKALAQDNPNLAPMLEKQIEVAEALAKKNPRTAARMNDPQFKSLSEMINYFANKSDVDRS